MASTSPTSARRRTDEPSRSSSPWGAWSRRRASMFCLPCRVARDGNRDGLPTVLLEAMAAGVPSVSTHVTGIPEILRDGEEGRLVPPEDPAALADSVVALLENPCERAALGRRARARA